jgi:uncharacterized protein (DUF1330 family)
MKNAHNCSHGFIHRSMLIYLTVVVLSFAAGMKFSMMETFAAEQGQNVSGEKPAYLVASWKILHPDKLKPFGDAVLPLAQKAGLKTMAASPPHVLEGSWPEGNVLYIQKYDSLQALLDFWRSEEHAKVIELREAHVVSQFVVAIEARK